MSAALKLFINLFKFPYYQVSFIKVLRLFCI